MKLREMSFSLGDFDHLYLNFTTCIPVGEIRPAARSTDRETRWWRYVDIGVDEAFLASPQEDELIYRVKQVLLSFAADDEARQAVVCAVQQAVVQGEAMLMRFKEKRSAKNCAVIYLRLENDGWYRPLLCVYDLAGNEILRRDLARSIDLMSIGEIQLISKRVTVKPRKNAYAFAQALQPVTFELNLE